MANPPVVYLLKRHRVQKVQFLAPAPACYDELRALEHVEMLGYRLPCHVKVLAQLCERLRIVGVKGIE
jgi:hypothetical protein